MSDAQTELFADTEHTYTVGELAAAINGVLRRGFGDGVWVRGEIQGYAERGPHAYFRIAEQGADGKAVLNVQLFAGVRTRLRPLLARNGIALADGLQVRIFGTLDMYAPSGQLGLKMTDLDPRFTLGDLALRREAVLQRLRSSGLLDANARLPLPLVPLRVGVVTSADSAAWADFRHEIERSGWAFLLRLVDARVQGDQAVGSITAALGHLGGRDDLDVIALIRGGGARSELATFDDEAIALAIAHCPLPVFTGLGHETDRSVADEVAHTALKTPTACAAALAERVGAFVESVDQVATAIAHRTGRAVDRAAERLSQRIARLDTGTARVLDRALHRLDRADDVIGRTPRQIDLAGRHLDQLAERIRLLDPATAMARGWSITRTADGHIVRDSAVLASGDILVTAFASGSAISRVDQVHPGKGTTP